MNFMAKETAQKLRGGYYTPSDLAAFLVRWLKEVSPQRILEPSCGDGAFFRALSQLDGFQTSIFTGFELNEGEAKKARLAALEAGLKSASVHAVDFLQWAIDHLESGHTRFLCLNPTNVFNSTQSTAKPWTANGPEGYSMWKRALCSTNSPNITTCTASTM